MASCGVPLPPSGFHYRKPEAALSNLLLMEFHQPFRGRIEENF